MIDASVLVALFSGESDAPLLQKRVEDCSERFTTPLALFEAALAISRKQEALGARFSPADGVDAIERFCNEFDIAIRPIDTPQHRLAAEAATRFGKGRHPAALNMGDCFAYAAARHHRVALMYKGADFAQTDLA